MNWAKLTFIITECAAFQSWGSLASGFLGRINRSPGVVPSLLGSTVTEFTTEHTANNRLSATHTHHLKLLLGKCSRKCETVQKLTVPVSWETTAQRHFRVYLNKHLHCHVLISLAQTRNYQVLRLSQLSDVRPSPRVQATGS